MRVVINQGRINRNRQIAQILFFVSLAVLIGGLIFTNTIGTTTGLLIFVPLLVMPLGLTTTIISVRLTNEYVRLPHPDESIDDGLDGIDPRSVLYHYVLPVKHVLIAPQGIYSLTTRFQETRYTIEGDKWLNWKARGPLAPIMLFLRQEALGDPFKEATKDAETIQEMVDKALPGAQIKVQPVVVFTSAKATLELNEPALPVVYADRKKKPSLKALLRKDKAESTDPAEAETKKAAKPKKKSRNPHKPTAKTATSEDLTVSGPIRLTTEQIDTLDQAFMASVSPRVLNGVFRNDEDEE